jgi:hypothetical protein
MNGGFSTTSCPTLMIRSAASLPGQAPVGRGHETGGLLVAGQNEPDGRLPKRFQQVQVLLEMRGEPGRRRFPVAECTSRHVGVDLVVTPDLGLIDAPV